MTYCYYKLIVNSITFSEITTEKEQLQAVGVPITR